MRFFGLLDLSMFLRGIFLLCSISATVAHSSDLNDTGIKLCRDATTNPVTCAAVAGDSGDYPRQDARYGRDAAAETLNKIGGGEAGFDFTALDAAGQPTTPSSGATPHPCVRDNVTGLVWEVKTNDGGLRSSANTYSWFSSDDYTNGGSRGTSNGGKCSGSSCDTQSYAAAVNVAALCSFKDWRVPSVRELLSIVHYGSYNPAIEKTYFPNTSLLLTWAANTTHSTTGSSGYSSSYLSAWVVDFYDGLSSVMYGSSTETVSLKSSANSVRLVRGGQF